ncbi:hypothetical protein HLB23_25695 [Nocardia uniformis]|uniref:Uncharacterized protein n=1 Tax=Nocardia uniformis TaxID=53432 RepID=A0A849CDI7_9NOCA|nr:hypothetical protein [Nocardia uniformis]NNH73209.1 hypothetical protein [Nocardia uniformis]
MAKTSSNSDGRDVELGKADVTASAATTVTVWANGARAATRSFGGSSTGQRDPQCDRDDGTASTELALAAVGTSLMIDWMACAVQRGLDYRELHVVVTAEGACDRPDCGDGAGLCLGAIDYDIRVRCAAPWIVLGEVRRAAESTCVAGDPVSGWIQLHGRVHHRGTPGPPGIR